MWAPAVRPSQLLLPRVDLASNRALSVLIPSLIPVNAQPFLPRAAPIRTPQPPLPLPFCFSARAAARTAESLAVAPHICRRLRSISPSPVSPSSSPLPYPIRHLLMHLLILSKCSNSQPNDASIVDRSSPTRARLQSPSCFASGQIRRLRSNARVHRRLPRLVCISIAVADDRSIAGANHQGALAGISRRRHETLTLASR
jgi:hypothetical protein